MGESFIRNPALHKKVSALLDDAEKAVDEAAGPEHDAQFVLNFKAHAATLRGIAAEIHGPDHDK